MRRGEEIREMLERLDDFLVEEVLSMSDEEILLEAFMNGEDTAAMAEQMRREVEIIIARIEHEKG